MTSDQANDATLAEVIRIEIVSRRSFLSLAAIGAGVAIAGLGPLGAGAALADAPPPLTGSDAAALAYSMAHPTELTLQQLQANYMLSDPWHSYSGDWCAVFASWITRGAADGGYNSSSSGLYSMFTPVDTSDAQAGDMIWYNGLGHSGVVYSAVNGAIRPIEGNCTDAPNKVHDRGYPIPGYTYKIARPHYPGGSSSGTATSNGEDMTDIIYYAETSLGSSYSSGSINVVVESMWYQECPGAPLFPLSGGLAYTATAAEYEYLAFSQTRVSNTNAMRYPLAASQIGALIQLRGQTTKPIGNF